MMRPSSYSVTLTSSLLSLAVACSCMAGVVVPVPIDLGGEEVMISPQNRLEELFAGVQTWPIIDNVQLRLVGSHTCQYYWCWPNPTYMVAATNGAIAFGFMVGETEIFRTTKEFTCVSDGLDFDITLSFAAGDTPDWSFLAEGSGTLFIDHQRGDVSCSSNVIPTYQGVDAYLTTVELLVEMPEAVPADTETWGTIKARYR